MSSNLYWQPVTPPNGNSLGTALKFVLREHYGSTLDAVLNAHDVAFLKGVMAGTVDDELGKDVGALIAAIEKHGEVRVWEQY